MATTLRDIERMVSSPRVLSGFLQADTSKLSIHDMRTVGKMLPHLLACAKFVEEHHEFLESALSYYTAEEHPGLAENWSAVERAGAALERLRLSRDSGTVKP